MFPMRRLRVAAVLAYRDARATPGRCITILLSLAMGVAAMHAMQAVFSQLSGHAASNSRQWMAADAAVQLGQSLSPEEWNRARAISPGARLTLVTELPAMVVSSQTPDPVAVQLKAVDPAAYPFYGTLELKSGRALSSCLDSQSAVVSEELLNALQVRVGAVVRIREADFRIRDVIAGEPDRFAGPYSPAPRVIVSEAGLSRTGLLRYSDTAFYHLLYKIPPSENTQQICGRLEKLFPNSEIFDYTTPMPLVSIAADWIAPFVGILGALALAFATATVASMSYLRFLEKVDTIAVLKSLGARSGQVMQIFLLQILALAWIGSGLGVAGGWIILRVCGRIILNQIGIHLQTGAPWTGAAQSVLFGVAAALTAAGASLWAIRSIRPAILLRQDVGDRESLLQDAARQAWPGAAVAAVPAILLLWIGESWCTRALFAAAALIACLAVIACVWLLQHLISKLIRALPRRLPFALRHGLRNPGRYGRQTRGALLVLIPGIALVLMAGLGRRQISDRVIDALPHRRSKFVDVQRESVRSGPPSQHIEEAEGLDEEAGAHSHGPVGAGRRRWRYVRLPAPVSSKELDSTDVAGNVFRHTSGIDPGLIRKLVDSGFARHTRGA